MQLRLGLNPYGFAYTVGLQGAGTPRANPQPTGPDGFLAVARELGARVVEMHWTWLDAMPPTALEALRENLAATHTSSIVSVGLSHQPGETLEGAVQHARALGAPLIRLGLTPVLEGSRAAWGSRWPGLVQHAQKTLNQEAPRARDAGIDIAIEDHQDFGSEELVAMAEAAGPNVGIVFDTGNPFAVGEDPVAFAGRVAHRVRHLHLKDYRAQFTPEGYRLVRCAIGDGAVPFAAIRDVLTAHHSSLTASLEPGALDARHIRLFRPDWWHGYPPREASELGTALGRLRRTKLDESDAYQTPWEREAPPQEIIDYELAQVRRSMRLMSALLGSPSHHGSSHEHG